MNHITWTRYSSIEERTEYLGYLIKKKFVAGKYIYEAWKDQELYLNSSYYVQFMQKLSNGIKPQGKSSFGWDIGI